MPSKVSFQSSIRYDGESLRISLPRGYANRRFEAYYAQGSLIVAQAKDDKTGIKPSKSGSPNAPCYYITFGRKWVGQTMPRFKLKTEVTMENGQFTLKVPEQDDSRVEAVIKAVKKADKKAATTEKAQTYVRRTDTIAAALNMLNKFVAEKDYEWDIKDGKASLVKYDRIG